MIEIKENVTDRLKEVYDIPVVKPVCPYDQTNIRSKLKPVVNELCHIDKLTRAHIYSAHTFSYNLLEKDSDDSVTDTTNNGEM